MRADTGVGPAMASGSQVCRGNWALLPMTPMNRATAPTTSTVWSIPPDRAARFRRAMSKLCPLAKKRMMIPMSIPASPRRVVKKAFRAASELSFSSHQWPMSMKEHSPTPSHPRRRKMVVLEVTSTSIDAVKRARAA